MSGPGEHNDIIPLCNSISSLLELFFISYSLKIREEIVLKYLDLFSSLERKRETYCKTNSLKARMNLKIILAEFLSNSNCKGYVYGEVEAKFGRGFCSLLGWPNSPLNPV